MACMLACQAHLVSALIRLGILLALSPVSLIPVALIPALIVFPNLASAEDFLLCKPDQYAFSAQQRLQWEGYAHDLLTQLAGDDLSAFFGFSPIIKVYHAREANAFAQSPNQIFISDALINTVESRNEFAFVLAHEVSHLYLQHSSSDRPLQRLTSANELIDQELQADANALKMLANAQLSAQSATSILRRVADQGRFNDDVLENSAALRVRIEAIERWGSH